MYRGLQSEGGGVVPLLGGCKDGFISLVRFKFL